MRSYKRESTVIFIKNNQWLPGSSCPHIGEFDRWKFVLLLPLLFQLAVVHKGCCCCCCFGIVCICPIRQVRFDPSLYNDLVESKSSTGRSPSTALPLLLTHDFNNWWHLKKPAEFAREPVCRVIFDEDLPSSAVDRRTFAPKMHWTLILFQT